MVGAEFVYTNAIDVDISTIVVVEILTCISKYQLNYRAPRRQVQPQEINFQLHPAGVSFDQMITFKTLHNYNVGIVVVIKKIPGPDCPRKWRLPLCLSQCVQRFTQPRHCSGSGPPTSAFFRWLSSCLLTSLLCSPLLSTPSLSARRRSATSSHHVSSPTRSRPTSSSPSRTIIPRRRCSSAKKTAASPPTLRLSSSPFLCTSLALTPSPSFCTSSI